MRTVQPEDLQLLLKRAKEEVPEEKKASPDDIKQVKSLRESSSELKLIYVSSCWRN